MKEKKQIKRATKAIRKMATSMGSLGKTSTKLCQSLVRFIAIYDEYKLASIPEVE